MSDPQQPELAIRRRISTLLFLILTCIAGLILAGLIAMSLRLFDVRRDLGELRDAALPRLVKLAQLSQAASATSSIAPALSMNPTKSEFETLLSRIKDKETSQRRLIAELGHIVSSPEAAESLRGNGDLLIGNLQALTEVVRGQIGVTRELDRLRESFRRLISRPVAGVGRTLDEALADEVIFRTMTLLFDANRGRFARNRREATASLNALRQAIASKPAGAGTNGRRIVDLWRASQEDMFRDKAAALTNAFKIKALAEENSLIANRLLGSASNEFWRASGELESQIERVNATTRFTLALIFLVIAGFGAGNFLVWYVMKRRVFRRLDRLRDSLQVFAETRRQTPVDARHDEIGAISASLARYMHVIDRREAELAEKTGVLERLSNQLSKYLSPQVYDSIFTGKQEVKVAASRKKLTIFFSDIAGFTETADRLESEELTQLLNHYLTEMSEIALQHGATIDKYIGDAILIFFGDPESRGVKQDALACVLMAIAMRRRLHELEDAWREAGIERPLRVRMGVHTGYCTVGNFGSEDRMDYTIVGGAVNVASRLEGKATPGAILISYETFAHVNDRISCEERGAIEVKGIAYPVATYEAIDSYENLNRERRRFRERHAHVRLDLDLDAMDSDDRAEAAAILRRGLDLVAVPRDAAQSGNGPAAEDG